MIIKVPSELVILGIRGLPAQYGGFETFAENLSLYLVERGWVVTVYCQEKGVGPIYQTEWKGVKRIHVPVKNTGALGTIIFDWKSITHSLLNGGVFLTLGYNTALFNLWLRLKGKKNLINMDGIEWRRDKWAWYEKIWLYLNERAGCLIARHLIADHPEIKNHLATRIDAKKITMIPYGARLVDDADVALLRKYSLEVGNYVLLIARPVPENSILEIIQAFSDHVRHKTLVVLGKYDSENTYHSEIIGAASDEVNFLGAVYDHETLDALRFYSCLYVHGHTVGGTNPSLIEALGAGQPVLAHDNKFNRWVAGSGAVYFKDKNDCIKKINNLLADENALRTMSDFSRHRFNENFTWGAILKQYENLLHCWI